MSGKFIISLDFELHWGGAEKWDLQKMSQYFLDTRESIPEVLKVFEENNIRATWATVGFLFAKDKEQLLSFCPKNKPTYSKQDLSYYNYFNQVGENEDEDPFHYGYSLIKKIIATKGQELATHTFAHYYCNEQGQNLEQFEEDLKAAQGIANENFNIKLKSLVFPRNQYNNSYLEAAKRQGIEVVRSNPNIWFWNKNYGKLTPLFRAIDTLFSISSTLAFDSSQLKKDGIIELPASRFFRPYKNKERLVQQIKLNRIKNEMTNAARNSKNYHLWWHPHNFGENIFENMEQLREIINHFKLLKDKYNFQSCSMKDFI